MKKTSKIDKKSQKSPLEGSKITFNMPRRSNKRSNQPDLIDLISLNQSILGNYPRRERN